MKVVAGEIDGFDLVVRHFEAGGIGVWVEFAAHFEAGCRRCCGDQLDDDLMADERLAAPVAGDEREQAMLDLVPLCAAET